MTLRLKAPVHPEQVDSTSSNACQGDCALESLPLKGSLGSTFSLSQRFQPPDIPWSNVGNDACNAFFNIGKVGCVVPHSLAVLPDKFMSS